jgi:transposase
MTRSADWWAVSQVSVDHAPVSAVASVLTVSWTTAYRAVADVGASVLIDDPQRFDHVRVIGVDEHCWRHTRIGDTFVTVIIDLTPVADRSGPARLLDMVEGRSKQVFKTWLNCQPAQFREQVHIVAMDGFIGYKTAAAEAVPDAVTVMDPFHVVALAGDQLDRTRQRIQQDTTGRRGHHGDPLYAVRRALHTGADLLTSRQADRLTAVFEHDEHLPVFLTWQAYQAIIAAYRDPDRRRGQQTLIHVIDTIRAKVPAGLEELAQLGRTLHRRRADILAWFDHPRSSNGPTQAINGRLEHLRGIALGFRNLTNYRLRSLLETGQFKTQIHFLS